MNRRSVWTVVTAALATAALTAAPASAECAAAEAYYDLAGHSRQYIVGPQQCVAPTPYPVQVSNDDAPVGIPGVVLVGGRAWLPLP